MSLVNLLTVERIGGLHAGLFEEVDCIRNQGNASNDLNQVHHDCDFRPEEISAFEAVSVC